MDELIKKLIYEAQSTQDVKNILTDFKLLDRDLWKPINEDYSNETIIRGQSPSPELALGERCTNSIDSILMRKCVEKGIDPWDTITAPKTMTEATEQFFNIPDGKLGKYEKDISDVCEIFCTATGRDEKKLTLNLVDFGEGQTPDFMKFSFLSLPARKRPYKLGIPFVQGRYNQGSSGSYKFSDYVLIVTKRAPTLVEKSARVIVDKTYDISKITIEEIYQRKEEWGWTLITKFPRRNSNETSWYGYLAPDDHIPSFKADKLGLIPPKHLPQISRSLTNKQKESELKKIRSMGTQVAYSEPIQSGTLVKLFDFPLRNAINADLWSEGARQLRSEVFYQLPIPIKMIELREWGTRIKGSGDAAYLTGLLNSILQFDKGENKLIRPGWPKGPEIVRIDGLEGEVKITKWILNTEKGGSDQSENWLGGSSVVYVLNGQVHAREKEGYLGRLKLYNLEGSLLVVVDVNYMPIEIRDKIFRVERAFMEETDEAILLKEFVKKQISDDDEIKKVNNDKFFESTSDVELDEKYTQRIIEKLSKDNPLMRELLFGTQLPVAAGGIKLIKKRGKKYKDVKFGVKSPSFFQSKRGPN